MIKKTKKDLQKEVEDLQFEVNRFKMKEKEKENNPKPIYVVYPEKDYCEGWYKENSSNITKFHEDENNFKYWQKHENWRDNKKTEDLCSTFCHDNLHHWSWFYIHGKLEQEVGYDICNVNIQFPFDEQLPYDILGTDQFIEGFGILYKVKAKLTDGRDILIFAHCGLRCSIMEYLQNAMRSGYAFRHMAQQFGQIKPSGEITTRYRKEIWQLRDREYNRAERLGFEPIYPTIPHHWGYWKDHLNKYKLVKVEDGLFDNRYRLDNLSVKSSDHKSDSIRWQGRIILPDDEESLDHCMNPLEWM